MAFAVRNLGVMAYAMGQTLWQYEAPADPIMLLDAPGYFDPAADMLTVGDTIIISTLEGAAMRAVRKIERAGTVTIGPML